MRSRAWEGDYRVSQGFSAGHPALDIAHPVGIKLFAPEAGVVTIAKPDQFGGLFIDVVFGNRKYRVVHLSRFAVGLGGVQKGQLIGYSGATGNVTGAHSHIELWVNNARTDPTSFLSGGDDMVNKDLLNAFFIDLLGRSPDPGAISTYQDKPDWPAINVYHAIRTSAERAQYLAKKQAELDSLKTSLANLDKEVVALRVEVKNNQELLKSQGMLIDKQEEELENQRKNILDQEKEIEALNQRVKELSISSTNASPSPLQSLLDRIITWFKERR